MQANRSAAVSDAPDTGGQPRWCPAGQHLAPVEEFAGGRNSCRTCERSRRAAHTEKLRQFYVDLLSASGGCADCGESDLRLLEADHIAPKQDEVSQMVTRMPSLDTFAAEFLRCEVRCRVCHIVRTLNGQRFWKATYGRLLDALSADERDVLVRHWLTLAHFPDPGLTGIENKERYAVAHLAQGCPCGESRLGLLEFHHHGPRNLSVRDAVLFRSMRVVAAELQQCSVRCVPCHRLEENPDWYRARLTPQRVDVWLQSLKPTTRRALKQRGLLTTTTATIAS